MTPSISFVCPSYDVHNILLWLLNYFPFESSHLKDYDKPTCDLRAKRCYSSFSCFVCPLYVNHLFPPWLVMVILYHCLTYFTCMVLPIISASFYRTPHLSRQELIDICLCDIFQRKPEICRQCCKIP